MTLFNAGAMTNETFDVIVLVWLFLLTLAVIGLFAGWIGHRHKFEEQAAAEQKRRELGVARLRMLRKSGVGGQSASGEGGTGGTAA